MKTQRNISRCDLRGIFGRGGKFRSLKFTPQQKFPQSDKDEDCGGSRDDEIVKGEKNNFL